MWNDVKQIKSNEDTVSKFIFTKENAIAEAVLYTYDDYKKRTVICCSTQSGCPVGCVFCGTGKKFIRNLTAEEIVSQVYNIIEQLDIYINSRCAKFQIMFMSMGEPFLNYDEVEKAIARLHLAYPNAELLVSTIGIANGDHFDRFIELSKQIPKIGLQFSIHESFDKARNALIPYKNKLTLEQIRDVGLVWWRETGRNPYLNYCVTDCNSTNIDRYKLQHLFSPVVFNFTFSVVCSADETMKDAGEKNISLIRYFESSFIEKGYNTRIFDPAGQDDIGAGCGMLWETQRWMREHDSKTNKGI